MMFIFHPLTCLTMLISRSIRVASSGIISFFFMAEYYSIVYMYHIIFIPLSTKMGLLQRALIWVLFLYTFSQSVSFGWSLQSIYIEGNYLNICPYCHFVNCSGFVFVGLFSFFILLWFDDYLQHCVWIVFSYSCVYLLQIFVLPLP